MSKNKKGMFKGWNLEWKRGKMRKYSGIHFANLILSTILDMNQTG